MEYYCSFCKNKCPLSSPKCENGRAAALRAEKEAAKAAATCHMCDKLCSYDDLGCSLGRMIAGIKARDDR